MPLCAVCDNPARAVIDEALLARDEPSSNGDTPSLELLCVQLQNRYGTGDLAFSVPEIIDHAKNCPKYVEPEPEEPDITEGNVRVVQIGDKSLPVPSQSTFKAHLLALGLQQMIEHPEIIRPHHVINILKLEGKGGGDLDELMDVVKNILGSHKSNREGPAKPPDVE